MLFVLVMALFALVILRPGWGARTSPTRWIVLGGLCLPALVLTPLVAYALIAGERLLPRHAAEPLRIEAEARQWIWMFRYPGNGGIKTEGILHLPAGVPIDVVVTSRDVIHAFWIPRLAGKIDAVPGHTNVLRIQADMPGRYQGLCNESLRQRPQRDAVRRHRPSGSGILDCGDRQARCNRESSAMNTSIEDFPNPGTAIGLHRQLVQIWATGPGLQRLAAVNHTVIGLRFMATAFVFFAIGGVLGMLARVQLQRRKRHSWIPRPTTRSLPCMARRCCFSSPYP